MLVLYAHAYPAGQPTHVACRISRRISAAVGAQAAAVRARGVLRAGVPCRHELMCPGLAAASGRIYVVSSQHTLDTIMSQP